MRIADGLAATDRITSAGIGRSHQKLKSRTRQAEEMTMVSLLRLHPVRAVVYRLIDANVFRHTLEERLKRGYIVTEAAPAEVRDEHLAETPAVPVPRAAAGGSRL